MTIQKKAGADLPCWGLRTCWQTLPSSDSWPPCHLPRAPNLPSFLCLQRLLDRLLTGIDSSQTRIILYLRVSHLNSSLYSSPLGFAIFIYSWQNTLTIVVMVLFTLSPSFQGLRERKVLSQKILMRVHTLEMIYFLKRINMKRVERRIVYSPIFENSIIG